MVERSGLDLQALSSAKLTTSKAELFSATVMPWLIKHVLANKDLFKTALSVAQTPNGNLMFPLTEGGMVAARSAFNAVRQKVSAAVAALPEAEETTKKIIGAYMGSTGMRFSDLLMKADAEDLPVLAQIAQEIEDQSAQYVGHDARLKKLRQHAQDGDPEALKLLEHADVTDGTFCMEMAQFLTRCHRAFIKGIMAKKAENKEYVLTANEAKALQGAERGDKTFAEGGTGRVLRTPNGSQVDYLAHLWTLIYIIGCEWGNNAEDTGTALKTFFAVFVSVSNYAGASNTKKRLRSSTRLLDKAGHTVKDLMVRINNALVIEEDLHVSMHAITIERLGRIAPFIVPGVKCAWGSLTIADHKAFLKEIVRTYKAHTAWLQAMQVGNFARATDRDAASGQAAAALYLACLHRRSPFVYTTSKVRGTVGLVISATGDKIKEKMPEAEAGINV